MEGFKRFLGSEDVHSDIVKAFFAELLGTFFYVFIGITSSVNFSKDLITSVVPVAFSFGLTLSSISHIVHKSSGAHLNPAVSVSHLVVGEMSLLKCACYTIAQCCGSCLAALMIVQIFSGLSKEDGVTRPLYVGDWQALVIEIAITFLMIIVFKAMYDPWRTDLHFSAPIVIGLSVTAGHLVGFLFSSSSMNPARSFGPALINNDFEHHWIYWAGPMFGAILGGLYYNFGIRELDIFDDDTGSIDKRQ